MNKLLSIILLVLLILVGGKRGFKTFITIYFNLTLIFLLVLIIGWGFNPIIPTLVICVLIAIIILFFLNGFNKKTLSSFIAVCIIIVIFSIITLLFSNKVYIQGYTEETVEAIGYVVYNTGIDMMSLSSCIILIGLIGNIVDTSIAISSALYEVHLNNPKLNRKELFNSGMNIGKDILGTTTNTLFFAYLGGYMTLLLFLSDHQYSFSAIINAKVFAIEITRIMLSGIASFLIIPLTSYITSYMCLKVGEINEENENIIRGQETLSSEQRSRRVNNSNTKRKRKNSIQRSKSIRKKTIS